MKKVTLSWEEFENVTDAAVRMVFSAWKKGSRNKHGYVPRTFFDDTVISRGAEKSVAKAINRYWDGGYDTYKDSPDVGRNVAVRYCTFDPPTLQIRPNDKVNEECVFFLVTSDFRAGELPVYYVHGYIKGKDAMQDKYLTDFGFDGINKKPKRPMCWAVPTSALKKV